MTAQINDRIQINEDEFVFYEMPLEDYWKLNNNKPPLNSMTTSLTSRGYYSKWLIEDKKLYLAEFFGECVIIKTTNPSTFGIKEYSLKDIFPQASEKVFADWFSGELKIQLGDMIEYNHGGVGGTYAYNTTIVIQNGVVVNPGSFALD